MYCLSKENLPFIYNYFTLSDLVLLTLRNNSGVRGSKEVIADDGERVIVTSSSMDEGGKEVVTFSPGYFPSSDVLLAAL